LIGVAGTWTSLAAIALDLPAYSQERVHGHLLSRADLAEVIETLAGMSVEETSGIPSLDPKRAPVILGGALVAEAVMDALGADQATISEQDSLDGVAMELLALP
jgi:exopolyphosphatase/guanosine-5'-triphosphate,3'-diphosphate pyrophosphatase